MRETFDWPWVEQRVARTIEVWNGCAGAANSGQRYCADEQAKREAAYDEGLNQVEREAKRRPRTRVERLEARARITASFGRFSAAALDLPDDAVQLLTDDFLPVGTQLARWARRFDESLSMADIIQANRNAWTACGLQPLLGERIGLARLQSWGIACCIRIPIIFWIEGMCPTRRRDGSASVSGDGWRAKNLRLRMDTRLRCGLWWS